MSAREADAGNIQPLSPRHARGHTHSDSLAGCLPCRLNSGDLGRPLFIQLLIDGIAAVFGLLFIAALAASLPLAVFIMILCAF